MHCSFYNMLSPEAQAELEKQQYRILGPSKHSTVKVCGWTKNILRGKGGCYKFKFYGINSAQCLQMSTSMSCANRCVFCWRGYKAPVSKEWPCGVDDPKIIIDEALFYQQELLNGFAGLKTVNIVALKQSKTMKHVALSLTGEPIIYPRINEAVKMFHEQGISTFMVTNAQYPKEIKALAPVTQLYLSIDAPNKEMLKEIDKPLFTDYWERMHDSLDAMREKEGRTTIRMTMIKGVNMSHHKEYAELIKKGDPDFVEVKSYMFVGASRQRLSMENMPYHEEIVEYSKELVEHLPDYELVDEHKPSRVVLLAKKKYYDEEKGRYLTWIDFDGFFAEWEKYVAGEIQDISVEKSSVRFTTHEQDDADIAPEDSTDEKDLD